METQRCNAPCQVDWERELAGQMATHVCGLLHQCRAVSCLWSREAKIMCRAAVRAAAKGAAVAAAKCAACVPRANQATDAAGGCTRRLYRPGGGQPACPLVQMARKRGCDGGGKKVRRWS